jgi:cytochrome oxidase Cu insertion factor (SCO1/SenC/PrrC family)
MRSRPRSASQDEPAPDASTIEAAPCATTPEAPQRARARRLSDRALPGALGVLLVASLLFFALAIHLRDERRANVGIRATGIPSNVSTSLSYLMGLSTVPQRLAPAFTLTDQAGRTVSMRRLRGRPIVLTFLDPRCTDVCPIISREFVDAEHDLGTEASRVVFLSVNVNEFHATVADMATFSRAQGLSTVPTWHFVTGRVRSLEAVWKDYGIYVSAPAPNADVIHTSVVYFIDASGRERFVAAPTADVTQQGVSFLPAGQLIGWARGIAIVARDLEP